MPPCSYAVLRKRAQALLAQINTLRPTDWQQRLRDLFMSDEVLGPLAVAWLCQQMVKAGPRQSAPFWQSQISVCERAARTGHQVRKGWEEYGTTPYEVCMHRAYYRNPILPRYNSEPNLRYMLC